MKEKVRILVNEMEMLKEENEKLKQEIESNNTALESISISETPITPSYSIPHRSDIPSRLLETSLQYVYLVKMPKLVNDKPEYKLGKSHLLNQPLPEIQSW